MAWHPYSVQRTSCSLSSKCLVCEVCENSFTEYWCRGVLFAKYSMAGVSCYDFSPYLVCVCGRASGIMLPFPIFGVCVDGVYSLFIILSDGSHILVKLHSQLCGKEEVYTCIWLRKQSVATCWVSFAWCKMATSVCIATKAYFQSDASYPASLSPRGHLW